MVEFKEQKCHTFEISYIKFFLYQSHAPLTNFVFFGSCQNSDTTVSAVPFQTIYLYDPFFK